MKANSWRELLGKCIADPQERQRIASDLGVRPITLTRWAQENFVPRPQNLRQLLVVLPQYRDEFIELIKLDMPDFNPNLLEEASESESAIIPGEFYMRVLQTRASMPGNLRYSVLCELILQQALKQLDPYRSGLSISIARCLPPLAEGPVSSLLADMGRGNPPWEQNMEHETMLLGAESLAGYAVISGRLITISNLHTQDNRFPVSLGAWEKSAVAAPISFEGNYAGSLIVSSTQFEYFSPLRQQLVSNYADLIALALNSEQFYPLHRIQLRLFPSQKVQQAYIAGFRKRVLSILKQPAEGLQPTSVIQAEHMVWQQIEAELLQLQLTEASQ